MIVADTGAVIALVDASERHHSALKKMFLENPETWILPWAILPEIDYLLERHVGPEAQEGFLADLADGAFAVEWGRDEDLVQAHKICARHRSLRIGLVDAVVIATAERLKAEAIATLDVRHFGTVKIKGNPKLLPRDR